MKIKPDYERIIDEILLLEGRMMRVIVSILFTDDEIIEIGADNLEPTAHNIAMIITCRPKNSDYIDFLKKVIKNNNNKYNKTFPITMSFEEIDAIIEKSVKSDGSKYELQYFPVLLNFFSHNIFQGETVELLKKKCKEIFDENMQIEMASSNEEKNKIIQFSDKLKGSKAEALFNGMMYEYKRFEEYIVEYDPLEIADLYSCKYDDEKKVYDNVKRGILFFLKHHFNKLTESQTMALHLIDSASQKLEDISVIARQLIERQNVYIANKERNIKLKVSNKSLKKEIKRLNDRVLKKIDKSSQKDLENKVHQLQKDNNYHLSRIEKMEEQIAILEEEKKLNAELEDNIIIEEKPEKKKTAKPEYQDIVILGGRWTSNNRKEVINFLPDNDIEFIEADKTLRNYDKIANSDIIFFDTSYNSHAYYYKVKKCNAEFYHINNSNLLEFEKIFGEEETGDWKQE